MAHVVESLLPRREVHTEFWILGLVLPSPGCCVHLEKYVSRQAIPLCFSNNMKIS